MVPFRQGDSFPHPLVPAGLLPADDARYSLAALFYEGTRVPLNFFLMTFFLACVDELRRFRRESENFGADQAIVEDHFGLAQHTQGLDGKQVGIARACSHKIHMWRSVDHVWRGLRN